MDNLVRYNKCFTSVLNVSEDELNEGFTFKDIDIWDSLAHLTLIAEIEDEFDIMLESDDILNFGSYNNGIVILKKYEVDL